MALCKNNTNQSSYFVLFNILGSYEQSNINIEDLENQYKRYADAFPDHPYTTIVGEKIKGKRSIQVGNRFVNFQLPDLNGDQRRLSYLHGGKIVLLNFWASWCGHCIKKSRDMIPIYQEYEGRDFTIIGVAREFEDTSTLEKTLKREDFPWENLVKMNDKHNIWHNNDLSYSGGGMFLVS